MYVSPWIKGFRGEIVGHRGIRDARAMLPREKELGSKCAVPWISGLFWVLADHAGTRKLRLKSLGPPNPLERRRMFARYPPEGVIQRIVETSCIFCQFAVYEPILLLRIMVRTCNKTKIFSVFLVAINCIIHNYHRQRWIRQG